MADKHTVRFEPVGIEIEVEETQTVLRAAAEQGIMLMHGCKEGQCASCKSFLLDGDDVEHDSYSTFALPDHEKDEGFTLLCRAHVYEDVTIELLNYDEEVAHLVARLRSGYGRHVGDPSWEEDIRRLCDLSPEFAELWARHEVAEPVDRTLRFRHPVAGELTFTRTELTGPVASGAMIRSRAEPAKEVS